MKLKSDLERICFPVEKIPTIELMKDDKMEFNSENSFAIVGTIGDRKKTLNFCSSVYALVENVHVLEPLIPVLEGTFKSLDIKAFSEKDAQFFVRMSPTIPSVSPNVEVIKPALTFRNSYDGKILAQATGGLVRYFVDEKGTVNQTYASFLKGLSFSYTFKHSNENIYSMHGIAAELEKYVANFGTVEKQIEFLKAVNIEKATTNKLEKLIRVFSKGAMFPLKEIEETIDRIHYEGLIFDTDPNLWSIYNAMNYILETSESALTKKMRIDADAKIFENIVEFVATKEKKAKKSAQVVEQVLAINPEEEA